MNSCLRVVFFHNNISYYLENGKALENWCVYCLLSPFDAEQQDMILRIQSEKKLRELPIYE